MENQNLLRWWMCVVCVCVWKWGAQQAAFAGKPSPFLDGTGASFSRWDGSHGPRLTRPKPSESFPSLRLIWTPVEAWQSLLQDQADGVVVPYGQLYARWQAWVAQQSAETKQAPMRWLLKRVHCEGAVWQGQQARLRIEMKLRVARQGWQRIFLPMSGFAVSNVELSGILGSVRATSAGFVLDVWGPSQGRLWIDAGSAIRHTPRGSVLAFQLPPSPVSQLRLRLPPEQEVSGLPLGVRLQSATDATVLEGALRSQESVSLVFRPREGVTQRKSLMDAHLTHRLVVRSNVQWLYADIQLRWRLGQRQQAIFRVPAGFRLVDIRSAALVDFSLRGKDQREVLVRLRTPQGSEGALLHVRLLRQDGASIWRWQPIEVADAYAQEGTLWVQMDRQLRYRSEESGALRREAVPNAAKTADMRGTSLYFVYWRTDARLALTIEKLTPRFDVHHAMTMSMKVRQGRFETDAKIAMKRGTLYQLSGVSPEGWQLYDFRDGQNKEMRFSRSGRRWLAELARPLEEGQSLQVRLVWVRNLQLPEVGEEKMALPQTQIEGASLQEGRIEIVSPAFYALRMLSSQQILPEEAVRREGADIQERLRYRILAFPYRGQLQIARKKPEIRLWAVGRYHVNDAMLTGDLDAFVRIQRAGIRRLRLVAKRANGFSWLVLSPQVEIAQQKTAENADGSMQWEIELSREVYGQIPITLRFQRRLNPQDRQLALPTLSSPDAASLRMWAAVAGGERVSLKLLPRQWTLIEPDLLPPPVHPKAAITPLVVYRSSGAQPVLDVEVRRYDPHQTLQVLVRSMQIDGEVLASGVMRVSVTWHLRSQSLAFFEAQLPEGAEMWSVSLNGKGVKPLREKQRIQVPLFGGLHREDHQIRVFYTVRFAERLKPREVLRAKAPQVTYPIQQTQWNLFVEGSMHPIFAGTTIQMSSSAQPDVLMLRALNRLQADSDLQALAFFFVFLVVLWWLRAWVWWILRWFLLRWRLSIGLVILLMVGMVFLLPSSMRYTKQAPPEMSMSRSNRFSRYIHRDEQKSSSTLDVDSAPQREGRMGGRGRRSGASSGVGARGGERSQRYDAAPSSPAATAAPAPAGPNVYYRQLARKSRRYYAPKKPMPMPMEESRSGRAARSADEDDAKVPQQQPAPQLEMPKPSVVNAPAEPPAPPPPPARMAEPSPEPIVAEKSTQEPPKDAEPSDRPEDKEEDNKKRDKTATKNEERNEGKGQQIQKLGALGLLAGKSDEPGVAYKRDKQNGERVVLDALGGELELDEFLKRKPKLGDQKKGKKTKYKVASELEKRSKDIERSMQMAFKGADARMMRGIRSLPVGAEPHGWRLSGTSLGAVPEIAVVLWQGEVVRVMMGLIVLLGLLLWLACGVWWVQRRWLFFGGSLFFVGLASMLFEDMARMASNGLLAGIGLAWVVSVLLGRKQARIAVVSVVLWFGAMAAGREASAQDLPPCPPESQAQIQRTLPKHLPVFLPEIAKKGEANLLTPQTPVFLRRALWEGLQRRQLPCRPAAAVGWWGQAHYTLRVQEARSTEGEMVVDLHLLNPTWQRIPLGLKGARLQAAKMQRAQGALRGKEQGWGVEENVTLDVGTDGYTAFLQGPGRVRLRLSFSLPEQKAYHRHLFLQLSPMSGASLRLHLPKGSWQMSFSEQAGGWSQTQTASETVVDAILGATRDLSVRWAQREVQAEEPEAPQIQAYHHVTIREALIRIQTRLQIQRQFRKHDRVSFWLPAEVQLESIQGTQIRAWNLLRTPDKRQQLTVIFEEPVQRADLRIQIVRLHEKVDQRLQLPLLEPVSAAQHVGFVGLSAASSIQWTILQSEHAEKRTPEAYDGASQQWGGTVQLAYAYQRQPALHLALRWRDPMMHIDLQAVLSSLPTTSRFWAKVEIKQLKQPRFTLRLQVPDALRFRRIETSMGAAIRQVWKGPLHGQIREWVIEFAQPLHRGQVFHIDALMPSSALRSEAPSLRFHGTQKLTGGLWVLSLPTLELQSDEVQGLVAGTLDEEELPSDAPDMREQEKRLFFKIVGEYRVRLSSRVIPSEQRATTHYNVLVQPDQVSAHVGVRFVAMGPGSKVFAFSVPTVWADQIEIDRPSGARLEQTTKEGRTSFALSWVQLKKDLHLRFLMRLPIPRNGTVTLPFVRAEGVEQQETFFALRKVSEVRVSLDAKERKGLDEISSSALPNDFLQESTPSQGTGGVFAAFRAREEVWSMALQRILLKTDVAMQPIVEAAHLRTAIAEQGQAWTEARYRLRTPGLQMLPLRLPEGAQLWQIRVQERPVLPARSPKDPPQRFLIPLPPRQFADLAYEIRVLYAHQFALTGTAPALEMPAPHLEGIEVVESFWDVALPSGWQILRSDGNMEETVTLRASYNRLEQGLSFLQKLQKLSDTGPEAQRRRAQSNLAQQLSTLQQSAQQTQALNSQLSWQLQSGKLNRQQARQTKDIQERLGRITQTIQQMRPRYTQQAPASPRNWQRFLPQQILQQNLAPTPQEAAQRTTPQKAFEMPSVGQFSSYTTPGAKPRLQLQLLHTPPLKKALAWGIWALLLLFVLFVARRFRPRSSST